MQVLVVSPYRTVAPHFETELEIAQCHLDQGDSVTFLSCLGELESCDFNTAGERDACRDCRLRRRHGLGQLSGKIRHLDFTRLGSRPDAETARFLADDFVSVEQLKQGRVQNFDIGYATLSSLVSQTRDPEPRLSEHVAQVQRFSRAALRVYQAMVRYLKRKRPDRVYVFNGRFASMRAVLRACQSADVECLVHERGCDTGHYQLIRNHLPHEIDHFHERILEHWNQAATDPGREATGQDWFHSRVQRVEKSWHSFVKRQQAGRMPENWQARAHNIAVFPSSEDEFVAIGDCWSNRLYEDQAQAITRLGSDLLTVRPDARLTVRIHPNLTGVDNASTRRLASIDLPNVSLIPAEAAVDSYQLMREADTVATFGSSVGIEAVFWNRPSVLLGPGFYQHLAGPRRARNHAQAIELLSSDLVPATRHEALIYGYWQNTHGVAFRHFEASGLFEGRFRGEVIYPKPARTPGRYVARQIASIRKRILPPAKRRAA